MDIDAIEQIFEENDLPLDLEGVFSALVELEDDPDKISHLAVEGLRAGVMVRISFSIWVDFLSLN